MKPHNTVLVSGILSLATFVALFSPGDDPFVAGWNSVIGVLTATGTEAPLLLRGYRPLLAILAGGLLYNAVVAYWFRNKPLSALETNVALVFLEADGSRVRIRREQVIRANHSNVKAYYMQLIPEAGASIPENEIDVQLCPPHNVVSDKELIGSATKGWECFQTFEPALPYTPFFPFIPKWFFLLSERNSIPFFGKYVLRRTVSAVYVNDLNEDKPSYELTASRYPHHNISVRVHFDPTRYPLPDKVFAHIIQDNGVHQASVTQPASESPSTYEVKVRTLQPGTRIRISWRLP